MTRVVGIVVFVVLGLLAPLLVRGWISSAEARLVEAEANKDAEPPKVAVAQAANEEYCTPALKKVLRRVLQSCGLLQAAAGRGCQPVDAKNVATMNGDDFNALFIPMRERGSIVQFDLDGAELDANDLALVDKVFADRRGASYFFVVARASPEGSVEHNRELSRARAEAVLGHLAETFQDPNLEREVGLLWLGEEYAQLDPSFCQWQRSGEAATCEPEDLNRSAFLTWVDCRL
jgi:outer membrane protein OmpA-like peptidoglycan-associated protein